MADILDDDDYDWDEDAERLNAMAQYANDKGYAVGTVPVPPKLNPDGSYADEEAEDDEATENEESDDDEDSDDDPTENSYKGKRGRPGKRGGSLPKGEVTQSVLKDIKIGGSQYKSLTGPAKEKILRKELKKYETYGSVYTPVAQMKKQGAKAVLNNKSIGRLEGMARAYQDRADMAKNSKGRRVLLHIAIRCLQQSHKLAGVKHK